MICEGEGGPTAADFWRLQLSIGLFVLAGLGVLLPFSGARYARREGMRLAAIPLHQPAASLALLTELAALLAFGGRPLRLGLSARRARRLPAGPTAAADHERDGHAAPKQGSDLLALFALPRPRLVDAEAQVSKRAPREGVRTAGERSASNTLPLLRLYGPLSVDPGDNAGLRLRAARGLVAYLALKRSAVSFEELMEALWPGDDSSRARARLHKAKQHARAALGPALGREGNRYVLDLARVRVDVVELERVDSARAEVALLESALELSRGEPLADVDYAFADNERRRLRSIRVDLLASVSKARLAAGERRGALDAAEELISLDRLNELGWRLAMEAEAALGSRQAIIERHRRLCCELDGTLGLLPQAETRTTYRRLLSQR